jgi:tripartite-type tricarboxylate transporter receptor subunit TctC
MLRLRRFLLACALSALSPGAIAAENYPNRAVRIIVPFGPGSGSDIVARRFAAFLQDYWKQPVVIDNRPGAQGVIGTDLLRTAPADGYTLGFSTNSTHAAAAYLYRKLPYEALRDFEHIALIGTGGSVAMVSRDSPFKSMAALVAHAKAHPGEVLYGHADTSSQVPAAMLRARGVPLDAVPYKTAGNIITDLIGGQIHIAFFNYMTGAAQAAGGRLVPIAITESRRNAAWPGVPIVAESYPGYEFSFFVGVSAPRGVPANVVSAIHDAIARAQDDRAIREQLEKTGLRFVRLRRGDYARFVAVEIERWRHYADAAGLIPQ